MASATDTSTEPIIGDAGVQLMRRAPSGYLWNQAGAIWLFVSLLLFEVVVRRTLPKSETNIFDLVSTAANLAFYLASFGLTSSGTVYLPRALVESGAGPARALAIRLVLLRLLLAVLAGALLIWGLPALVAFVIASGWPPGIQLTSSFTVQALIAYRVVIAAYVVAVGMSTLLSSLLIALVRTRVVFIFGSLGQLLLLVLGYLFIRTLDGGVNGALAAQALSAVFTAIIFALVLWRVLRIRTRNTTSSTSATPGPRFWGPVLQLSVAAWLSDLPSSSLVQPLAIGQLAAVAPGELLYFKSTYQMGDAGARFFTDGLGGVSLALMSTSYSGKHLPSLAIGWRTVNKLQVLLALPVVIFAIPHASAIMSVLFGPLYAQSGYLLAVFLIMNGLAQLLGGATHQWALYVLGQQRWVVVAQWATVGIMALTGAVLVPRYFALGALIAVGIGRLTAQVFLFVLARMWVRQSYPVAFSAKVLLALAPAAAVTVIWQPATLVASAISHLHWLPSASSPVVLQGLVLAVQAIIFFVIFVVCLRVICPLDSEDAALLAQVPPWLRKILMPLVRMRPSEVKAETSDSPR